MHGVQGDSDWGKTGFSLPWSILPIPEGQWITSVYVCADLLVRCAAARTPRVVRGAPTPPRPGSVPRQRASLRTAARPELAASGRLTPPQACRLRPRGVRALALPHTPGVHCYSHPLPRRPALAGTSRSRPIRERSLRGA